jgi:small conductance mechanosensitive channel
MDVHQMIETASPIIVAFGLKVLGAIVVFIVGRWLIGHAAGLVTRLMERQQVDPTLTRYTGSIIVVALNIILVVAILGYFGVETTSFAALVAGLGIAIGAAWGGLLSNFAAGAFILMLRPFKVGDYVLAGDVEGTVRQLGLFSTTIDSPDNVQTLVGNAKIMNGTVKNFSANAFRRVDLTAQLDHGVDVHDAIARLRDAVARIPNTMKEPRPDVEVLTFSERGPVLAVRPYCNTAHYWQVYFDANRAIRDTCGTAGYPVPEAHLHLRGAPDGFAGTRPSPRAAEAA